MVDTFRSVDPSRDRGEGTRHGFRGGTGGERIDWILASRDFKAVAAGIERNSRNGRYPSDHFPVTAVLRRQTAVVAAGPQPLGG